MNINISLLTGLIYGNIMTSAASNSYPVSYDLIVMFGIPK